VLNLSDCFEPKSEKRREERGKLIGDWWLVIGVSGMFVRKRGEKKL